MTDFHYTLSQVEQLCVKEFGWDGTVGQDGSFTCYCPIHGDTNASLSVSLKEGVGILIKCWSHGCEKEVYKLLTERGAWPQQVEAEKAREENRKYEKKYPERSQPKFKWNSIPVSHRAAAGYASRLRDTISLQDKKVGRPVQFHKSMVHIYTDGDFANSIVVRYDAVGHPKRILQYSFGYYDEHDEPNRPTDPNNPKWQCKGWSSEKHLHMLYSLTYVSTKSDAIVIVVEGEKAADYGNTEISQRYPGYVFTTWKGGTQAVGNTDWSSLKGRNVIIIPDADTAGVLGAFDVKKALGGIATSIDVVDINWFNLPKKWDIADYPTSTDAHPPKFLELIARFLDESGESHNPRSEISYDDDADGPDDQLEKGLFFPFSGDYSHFRDMTDYFNQRFGVLLEGRHPQVVILDSIYKSPEEAIIPYQSFSLLYGNIKIEVEPKKPAKNAAAIWFSGGERRKFSKSAVNPSKGKIYKDSDNGWVVNLWQGVAAESMDQSGSCEKFLEHVKFICSGEEDPKELHDYVMRFLAHMIQTPDKRSGGMLALIGEHGSGKSIFGDYLQHMLGDQACFTSSDVNRITGQFNHQLLGKLLIRVEEAKISQGAQLDTLKHLSTSSTFVCEAKGKGQITRDNFMHFIFTTNRDSLAQVTKGERRLVPIEVPDTHVGDTSYWDALLKEKSNGGPWALYKYLKEYKLPNIKLEIPKTSALAKQKMISQEYSPEYTFNRWYSKSLYNGGFVSGPSGPSFMPWNQNAVVERSVLWDLFEAWQKESIRDERRHMKTRAFYKYLRTYTYGKGQAGVEINNNPRGRFLSSYSGVQKLMLPGILEAKQTFVKETGDNESFAVYNKEDSQSNLNIVR